jgi:hypothetical protein
MWPSPPDTTDRRAATVRAGGGVSLERTGGPGRTTVPYLCTPETRPARAPTHRSPPNADLAPMRGLVYGVVLGALLWSVVVALVLVAVIR